MKKYKVLVVDDHPIISNAYIETLESFFKDRETQLFVETAEDIDMCLSLMEDKKLFAEIDLVILDIKLPPSLKKIVLSGEDLGIRIKREFECKILISTTFNDNYRVYSILKSVDPDGFVIKNDLNPKSLRMAVEGIINDPPFYSNTVLQLMRKEIHHNYSLDEIDRQLLYELSIGTKMKNLPEILPLSIAGVEKRKRNLKIVFNVENEGDRGLILAAKEKGFL